MKITKRILLVLSVVALLVGCFAFMASAAEGDLVATFTLGADGSAGSEDNKDGSSATSYTETVNGYTLNITNGNKMYKGSYDANGNGCLKLGTSSAAGSFEFTVPDDVTSVVIHVAGYKANAASVTINGTVTALTGRSASGTYDAIEVDTSTTKTVTLTVSSNKRAKVNTIEFYKAAVEEGHVCSAETLTFVEATEATCFAEGNSDYYQCECNKYYSDANATEEITKADTVIAKTAHTDANNDYVCDVEACKAPAAPAAETTLTIEQANMLGKVHAHQTYTEGKYYVTGVITQVKDASWGNIYIEDEGGTQFYIYGLYTADDSHTRYDAMTTKPVVGDTVTVYGVIGAYNGTAQMSSGWLTAHEVAPCDHADNDGDYQCDQCGVAVAPEADTTLTLEQANKLGLLTTTTGKYYVTGVVTEIESTMWGNIYIEDEDGTQFYIYGTYSADGEVRYDAMATKPVVGDTITVYGVITSYNGKAQMSSGWLVEHTVPEVEPMDYSFVVPYGCEAPASGSASQLTLPEAPAVKFGNGKYVFAGWSTAPVENTTTAPETFAAGEVYTLTEETTFYAVYTYEKDVEVALPGTTTTVYEKVTGEQADWSGKYLIVYDNAGAPYIYSGVDAVNGYISGLLYTDGNITPSAAIEAYQVTIEKYNNGYSIFVNGNYIGQTSDANGTKFSATTKYENKIEWDADKGWVNIVSGGAYLRFNATSGQYRFRYYRSSTYTSQKAIQLFKLTEVAGESAGTTTETQTFYTTFEADFYSANVRLEESLLVNYYVALNTSYNPEDLKVVFTMNGEATEMLAGVVAADGRLVFTFDGIAPQLMGANIKAELYNGDEVIKAMNEYSVKTNLEAIYPEDETSELAKLIDATLAYGAAAQNYTGTDTENLVGTLDNLGTVESAGTSNVTYAQDGYTLGASVLFDGLNRVAIFVDKNDVTITCTVAGSSVEVTELAYSSANGMYYVLLEPVYATALEDVYTITVENEAGVVATIEYNLHAYCYAHANDADVNTKNLAVAYYEYCVAAIAYNN